MQCANFADFNSRTLGSRDFSLQEVLALQRALLTQEPWTALNAHFHLGRLDCWSVAMRSLRNVYFHTLSTLELVLRTVC